MVFKHYNPKTWSLEAQPLFLKWNAAKAHLARFENTFTLSYEGLYVLQASKSNYERETSLGASYLAEDANPVAAGLHNVFQPAGQTLAQNNNRQNKRAPRRLRYDTGITTVQILNRGLQIGIDQLPNPYRSAGMG